MDQIRLTLLRSDAEEVREVLRPHLGPVWYTECRRWWLWVRFTISGSPQALQRVQESLSRLEAERFIREAW